MIINSTERRGSLTSKYAIYFAPAKINLNLAILGKRDDGYHDIQSIIRPIDLYDELIFQKKKDKGICLKCDAFLKNDDNLVFKAARLLLEGKDTNLGYEIKLKKNIPIAAGLGGGSSDAATTLLVLNKLYDLKLSKEQLKEIGGKLGADIPFFIDGCSALVEGKGERLTPLKDLPEWRFLLVNPGFEISTKWAYEVFASRIGIKENEGQRTKDKQQTISKKQRTFWEDITFNLTKQESAIKISAFFSKLKDIRKIKEYLKNDLEIPVLARYPELKKIKELLLESGAEVVGMSGSGPTFFGMFVDYMKAQEVLSYCLNKGYWTKVVKAVDNNQLTVISDQ
ncbi:MAG: 4-(cytidine 5'-diphospho)-2-C-methyl-D-erythritol kinase [bacterium]